MVDSDRLPWLVLWTRIWCDAVLLVGGATMAWWMLFTSLRPWFFPYGILAIAIVALTAYSKKRRSRKTVAFLLLAILLNIAAITLLVASWGKISPGVLLDLGDLAAWPAIGLLWLFLDHRATCRLDHLTSIDLAEKSYQRSWEKRGKKVRKKGGKKGVRNLFWNLPLPPGQKNPSLPPPQSPTIVVCPKFFDNQIPTPTSAKKSSAKKRKVLDFCTPLACGFARIKALNKTAHAQNSKTFAPNPGAPSDTRQKSPSKIAKTAETEPQHPDF